MTTTKINSAKCNAKTADMALEKAKEQVQKFNDYCDATKSELDSKYYTLTNAEQRKLIDRLYEIRRPNVKFKIGEKVIPLFAMTEKRFIGKENGEYLLVEYEYIEDHGDIVYDGMVCKGLSGDGCPSDAEYVFDENNDLQNKKFLDPRVELPF